MKEPIIFPKNITPRGISKGDIGLMNRDGALVTVDTAGTESPVGGAVTAESIIAAIEDDPAGVRVATGSPIPNRPVIRRIAFMGDSITAGAWYFSTQTYQGSWPTVTRMLLSCAFDFVPSPAGFHFASSGHSLSEIIDDWLTPVCASNADAVVIHAGTNSPPDNPDETAAEKMADWTTIIEAIVAAGKLPIATTVLPRGAAGEDAYQESCREFNALMRVYCWGNNIPLCDWGMSIIDPATGKLDLNYSPTADYIHPDEAGAYRMAPFLARTLAPFVDIEASLPDMTSARWVSPNPFMVGDVSGGATTHQFLLFGGGSAVKSKVARTDGISGEWQQLAITAPSPKVDGAYIRIDSTVAGGLWEVGDEIEAVAEIEIDAGSTFYGIGVGVEGVVPKTYGPWPGSPDARGALNNQFDVVSAIAPRRTIIMRSPSTVIQSGATLPNARVSFYGAGTVRVGRFGLVKVN